MGVLVFSAHRQNDAYTLKNLKPMLGKFSLSSFQLILDAGCGYGVRTLEISRKVGAHVISIDLSQTCLHSVKQQKEEFGINNIDLIRADLQNIPLKDNCVDAIVSGDVLEHIPVVSKTVKDFYRLIKEEGTVFLLVPSKVTQKLYVKLDNNYLKRIGHVRIFNQSDFRDLVTSQGFSIVSQYRTEFFRSIYHLLQVLKKSRVEHQTGRLIEEDAVLSTIWRMARILYYSWVGSFIEAIGRFILPNSLVIIATKKIITRTKF